MYADSVKGKTVDPDKLIWVAKLERKRKYKDTDPKVRTGLKKEGELKAGDQRHFHAIMARKTSDNKMSISPLSSYMEGSKGVIKSGFERNCLRQAYETAFDQKFNYNRPLEKSFKYQNAMKHGTVEEKKEMQQLLNSQKEKAVEKQPEINIKQQQDQQ